MSGETDRRCQEKKKKKSANGNERQWQTGREVERELNLQDQVECLSQEPTASGGREKRCSSALSPS